MEKEKLPASASVIIEYTNSKGECGSRQVSIKRFCADGSTFSAVCYRSRRVKTFKFSSVSEAVDAATGEVVGDLYQWLLARHQEHGSRDLERFIEEHRCLIDILVYMSLCDGQIVETEREEVACWLLNQAGLGAYCLPEAMAVIRQWPAPDLADFDYSAEKAAQTLPDFKEALLMEAANVMLADSHVHKNEIDLLARLKRLLG